MSARRRPPRGAVIAAAIAAAAVVVALVSGPPRREGPPLDPRSDTPLGTSALVALLERFGAEVELSVGLPDRADDVALVLQDRLDEEQTGAVVEWVRRGGTLVVTDPGSSLSPMVRAGGLLPDTEPVEPGRCTIDALDGIGDVDGGAAVRYEVPAGADACYGDAEAAYVVTQSFGAGEVVAVGGAAFVTNDKLDEHDNAVLALALLAPEPGTAVRFVDPPLPVGGGDKALTDLVPDGVKRALVQLAVAFVLYALWRAIRFGRPVLEPQPVEIAGSELVAATGRLLSRTRAPSAVADAVREDLRRRLRARFGVGPHADHQALAAVVAARTGLPEDAVRAALDDRPVTTDDELVALVGAVAALDQEVHR